MNSIASKCMMMMLAAGAAIVNFHVARCDEVLPIGEYEITVFLSDVGAVDGGVELGNPTQDHYGVGGTGTLYLWIDPGEVGLDGASFRLRSVVPNIISVQEPITVYNPNIVDASQNNADTGWDRWDATGDTSWFYTYDPEPEITDTFVAMSAFFDTTGIDPALDGSGGWLDPLYDTDAGAFLFAKIDYDVVGLGTTPLYLEIGNRGITSDIIEGHSSEVDVFFGDGEVLPSNALNAWSQRLVPSVLPDAIINVFPEVPGGGSHRVPEPSGLALLALGAFAPLFGPRSRRRRVANDHGP